MDFKLLIGVDITDYDDLGPEAFDEDDEIDVFINDGDDYMLAGKILFDEGDISDEPYHEINLKIISKIKKILKSKFYIDNNDVRLFVIYE